MTLYSFPDPRAAVQATLEAARPTYWPGATIDTAFPTGPISAPWIQHAWDGTPSEERQREFTTIRVTVWTPRGQVSAALDLAALAKAVLLNSGSDAVWRFTSGTGRSHGTDDDNGLPFCTFTLTAETRPSPVA